MILTIPQAYRTTMLNKFKESVKNTDILVEFFGGVAPTNQEILDMIPSDRIDDKLGEVVIALDDNGENSVDASFTPSTNGLCTWVRFSPTSKQTNIIVSTFIGDLNNKVSSILLLNNLNLDSTVENTVKKIMLKIQ